MRKSDFTCVNLFGCRESDITTLLMVVGDKDVPPKATYFAKGEKKIIRATRRTYKARSGKEPIEILLTFGRPNFAERAYLKKNPLNGAGRLTWVRK